MGSLFRYEILTIQNKCPMTLIPIGVGGTYSIHLTMAQLLEWALALVRISISCLKIV